MMELEFEMETALLEAVLYMETEPITIEQLSKICKLDTTIIETALEKLGMQLHNENRGLELLHLNDGWMLFPKKQYWEQIRDRYAKHKEQKLSKAALETLSIIAYSQPITRAEIEAIRGVSADTMIRFLLEKKLIKEVGRKEVAGRPIQYGTTQDFLDFFGLSSIADLPKLDETEQERFDVELD